jgi:hypothetical protein
MAFDAEIRGLTGTQADVNSLNHLKVITETDSSTNPDNIGCIKVFGENDGGYLTGTTEVYSGEVDIDYRQRIAQDLILDECVFNYTAQDTGKHSYSNTTMANSWTAGQLTTNSGSITTTTTGTQFATYATFPNTGTQTLSADFELAFSAQPTTNTFIEFGLGLPGTQTTAPTDGVFIRLTSAGLFGVASNNGTETVKTFTDVGNTGSWPYTNNKRYQFIVYMGGVEAKFWVNDGTGAVLLGKISLPAAQGRICMSRGVQVFHKHRITGGAAGGVMQSYLGAYNVRLGGSNITSSVSTQGNRIEGGYQGFGGGTLGTLARIGTITTGNEANVTAAVPTTTTAALGSGLGGTFWETVSLAVNTDGIIQSYQVPAVTVNTAGRRLCVRGIFLNSYVQTVLVGGPYIAEWFLAFGHTAVSLATTEAATTKAPRRIVLPFVQAVTAAQAVGTLVSQNETFCDFGDAPVFVNSGEFIQLCTRHIGTVGVSGTVVHRVTFVYGWE